MVNNFSSSPKLATIKNQLLMCMVDDCVVGYMSDISTGLRYICYISHMWSSFLRLESREKATSSVSTHVQTNWTLLVSISSSFLRKLPWLLMTQMPRKSSLCVYSGPSNKLDVANLSTDVGLSSSGHSNEPSKLTHHYSNRPILGSFFIRQHSSKALFYWNGNTFFQQFETGRKCLYIFLLPTTTLSHFYAASRSTSWIIYWHSYSSNVNMVPVSSASR